MSRKATRRQFLKKAACGSAAAMSFPYIVPGSALGKNGTVAPSNRLVLGGIGLGGKGKHNVGRLMGFPEVQAVAVCDVERKHAQEGRDMINQKYGNQDCALYDDFRDLVARKDIDIIAVSTPDHWHALASVAALNAGKDVYCEKPLTNSVGEGRAICEAVSKNGRVLQTGSQERSGPRARFACELVRNNRIGKLHTIEINLPCNDGHHKEAMAENQKVQPVMPVPEGFDYDMWLGHTPVVPYTARRCHFWWRFILSYGGGEMTDRGAHVIDIAQLGNGTDRTGPVEFTAKGSRSTTGLYDTFMDYSFECKYANGVRMVGANKGPRGLKFVGDKGWIFVHIHGAKLEAEPASLLEEKIGPDEIQLGRTSDHHANFVEAVKTRKQPFAEAEIGHRTATICHLNNIAMLTGKKLIWDPAAERITNDKAANELLTPKMRMPWHL